MSNKADHDGNDVPERIQRRSWCGIYTRQSRASTSDFSSCEAQRAACLDFVMAKLGDGWVWNGRRYDDEGESGETIDRPGLQRLLADIRAGKVERVVVHRLDRLSRRIVDCTAFLQELRDRGIPLTVVTSPELEVTAEHTLVLNLMASFAEFEREMTRERLADSRAALKRRGRRAAGRIPYGYETDPCTKQLVLVPAEARRVRKMFRMAAAGQTPTEIAAVARRRGWKTKQRTSKTGRVIGGGYWTPRQILATLSNPVYAGRVRDGETTRPGIHEAVVHPDLFDRVQAEIASRRTCPHGRRSSSIQWPLRGILKCGRCGRPMSPKTSGHGNIRYRYYRCRSHAGGKPPCRGVSVPAQDLEQSVIALIAESGPDEADEGTRDAVGALADRLPTLPSIDQFRALLKILREVVFDVVDSAIRVTLDKDGLEDFVRDYTSESA